jgi:hypothetical protein
MLDAQLLYPTLATIYLQLTGQGFNSGAGLSEAVSNFREFLASVRFRTETPLAPVTIKESTYRRTDSGLR